MRQHSLEHHGCTVANETALGIGKDLLMKTENPPSFVTDGGNKVILPRDVH